MIIVLDNNVIISALLSKKGSPARIVRRWEAGEFDLLTSPPLLDELRRALAYERVQKYMKLSEEEIATFIRRFRTIAVGVDPQVSLEVIEKDPDDNRLLECAVAGRASFIVSGDEHLLELKEFQGIVILSPAGFITMLEIEAKNKGK